MGEKLGSCRLYAGFLEILYELVFFQLPIYLKRKRLVLKGICCNNEGKIMLEN